MTLNLRRIYATNCLLFNDVIHLHIPYPQSWKVAIMFVLMFLLPFTFNRRLLDAHCARILYECITAALPLLRPKSAKNTFRKLANLLCNKASAAALLVFALKCYVCYIGFKVKNEAISFNQPVIFRTVNRPVRSPCKLMTFKGEREFMLWEALHCTQIKPIHKYHEVTYVPSVRTVDGSEQRCSPRGTSTLRGRIQVNPKTNPHSVLPYEHPISLITENCRLLNISCDFIKHASAGNKTTWIACSSPQQSIVVNFHDNFRPGLTAIREGALAVRTGANEEHYTKIAFGIELMMRHSTCFAKRSVVDTIRMPHLVVHVMPLIALSLLEGVCRRLFNRLVDTPSGKHPSGEYLSVAIEETLS